MKAKRTVMIMCLIVGNQIQASAVDYKKDNLKISRSITDSILYKILLQLDLNENDLNKDLCVIKPLPQHEKFSVCVIPKFSKAEVGQYDKDYYELDAYILVVESNTGKIVSKFFEPKAWVSEAVWMLSSIDIDTIPYILNSRICGFGIRTHSDGSSRPNPAYSSDFSLFILDGKNLRRIINSYPVSEFHGEWDTNCKGEFEEANSVIIVDNKISNNYHDILIKKTISKIEHYLVKDNCKEKVIKKSFKTVTLKYNGKEYK